MEPLESTPPPPIPEKRRSHHWRKFIAQCIAGTVLGTGGILAVDGWRSWELDRQQPQAPVTDIVDFAVTWDTYPQKAAETHTTSPELEERCRESKFVVVTFSGTAMQESQYQANMITSLVESLGGCVMYHWYGNIYDAAASADSVATAIERVTPTGEHKPVVFLGASFGGIAAEDIATQPIIENSPVIDLRKIIMIATPVDMNDVIQDAIIVPVPLIKDIPVDIPHFGDLVILLNAINGQRERGELLNPTEWNNTFINASKTNAGLTWSELERIRQGMLRVRDIPTDYIGSPDSDRTVNTDQAVARIDNLVINSKVHYYKLNQAGHDLGWLVWEAPEYNKILSESIGEVFGHAA